MLLKKTLFAVAVLTFVGVASAAPSSNHSLSSSFQVTMTVSDACDVHTEAAMDLSVNCSSEAPYFIDLEEGGNGSADHANKALYRLHAEPDAKGRVAGDSDSSASTGHSAVGVGNASAQHFTAYASAPKARALSAHNHEDVTVYMSY
ncbi:hypothetical protein AwPolaro_03490 [Polaromonas sp.]|nr:hypothetical protein AwPolaro_03490 [Polaromonas sp.]